MRAQEQEELIKEITQRLAIEQLAIAEVLKALVCLDTKSKRTVLYRALDEVAGFTGPLKVQGQGQQQG